MFKKIRNRILLLNMVMVSSVVIVAFVVVYVTTYTRIQNENRDKLRYAPPSHQMTIEGEAYRIGGAIVTDPLANGADIISGFATRIAPDSGLSFSVLLNSDLSIVEINSMVDLQSETYIRMAGIAAGNPDSSDVIVEQGRRWQYAVSPVTAMISETAGPGYPTSIKLGEFSHIRFLDVTDSYRTIRSLAFMLSGLTLIVLAVFYFISRYFANRSIKPMEEAWEMQSRFITDASHELRTPLSVINANCGVLYAEKVETVESQLKWLDSIVRAADRMSGLISSLLSLASMEDKQAERSNTRFSLSGELAAASAEIEAAALEKRLSVDLDVEQDVEIESDREQVRKVLSILLDNAVKYTDNGGQVSILLKKEKRRVICTVRNSGDGIPLDILPRVFDRFFRGDPARSSENSGYGLGLSIAKAITEKLDAGLAVESLPGEFTEFKLDFSA